MNERERVIERVYERERRCMRMKDRCTWQREQRERERDHHPTHPRPIPKLYYLPVLLIDSLLSTKK